jgi:SAM-dependent methyltransferase
MGNQSNVLSRERRVVIYGAGSAGRAALAQLATDDTRRVIAFADSDAGKHGSFVDGVRVVAPTELTGDWFDEVIAASQAWRDITGSLARLGVPERSIAWYHAEDRRVVLAFPEVPDAIVDGRLKRLMSDRVHYACGRRLLDGWLNVDGFDESYPNGSVDLEMSKRIYRMDLTAPHPFPDNTFQWGYSEDFLEHLTQAESLIFLCEAYRTFRPGGVLRLSFPGLPGILRRHLRSGGYAGAAVCIDEAYTRWWHEHFYTFESIELVAYHIGYSNVTRHEYGHSRHAVLKQESRPNQADLNLIVELTK